MRWHGSGRWAGNATRWRSAAHAGRAPPQPLVEALFKLNRMAKVESLIAKLPEGDPLLKKIAPMCRAVRGGGCACMAAAAPASPLIAAAGPREPGHGRVPARGRRQRRHRLLRADERVAARGEAGRGAPVRAGGRSAVAVRAARAVGRRRDGHVPSRGAVQPGREARPGRRTAGRDGGAGGPQAGEPAARQEAGRSGRHSGGAAAQEGAGGAGRGEGPGRRHGGHDCGHAGHAHVH